MKPGDAVTLQQRPDEYIAGEIVDTDFPDVFSEGWKVRALVTEGGHPKYGQVGLYSTREVFLPEVTG